MLTYRGYSIDDLAEYTDFEEVIYLFIYLLWYGKLPTLKQLETFRNELNVNASLSNKLITQLKSFPTQNIHPMAVLRTCVSALALYDDEADETDDQANFRKAIRLQAKIPAIIAAYARICEGKEPILPVVWPGSAV